MLNSLRNLVIKDIWTAIQHIDLPVGVGREGGSVWRGRELERKGDGGRKRERGKNEGW